jgi:hypothetical protein
MTMASGDDADHHSTSSGRPPQSEGLTTRFRAWRRAFVTFGAITGIIVVILIGLFLLLGQGGSTTAHPAPPSSQSGQAIAVAGLIVACISAIGTLFSGLGTLMTARAMARQGATAPAPKPRAKPSMPRTRKRS